LEHGFRRDRQNVDEVLFFQKRWCGEETVFNGEKLGYRFLLDFLGVTVLRPSSW
jgi:hypothetical protein